MLTAPSPSPRHLAPLAVAPDTFLLRCVQPMVGAPLAVPANSLLIRGTEPVLVDTGPSADREEWLADLAALVDLSAIRWIVLTHDAERHRGNLATILARCPEAILVTSWAATERALAGIGAAAHRLRWLEPDEALAAGDRKLRISRPPVYDSPAARTVFDASTGVLWGCDLFATPVPPQGVERVDELSPAMWAEGTAVLHHHALAPWVADVDRGVYAARVSRLRALAPAVVVASHAPVIPAASVDTAFAQLAALPDRQSPPHPALPHVTARTPWPVR